MQNKIQQKIKYLESRRRFDEILERRKPGQISEYASTGLFSAMGGHLGDIFKSMKLTAMDISNELRFLGQKFLYRKDPQKLKATHDNYNRKRDKILKNWEPIVKNSMDAIKNTDPFLALLLAPQVYLASKTLQVGIESGKTATEIIAAEDWESIRAKINKFQTGTKENPNAGLELGIGAIHDQMSQQNNILLQLSDLFMGDRKGKEKDQGKDQGKDQEKNESHLREQEGEKQERQLTDPKKWLATFFEITGVDDEFTIAAYEMLDEKKKLAEEMIDPIKASTTIMKLVSTSSPSEFKKTVGDVISSADIPGDAVQGLSKVFPEIEEQAKKLSQSPDFKREIAAATKQDESEISDEEVVEKALQVVFRQAKSKFDEQYKKDLEDFIKIIEANHEDINTDDEVLSLISARKGDIPTATDFLKVYEQYAKAYKDYDKTRKAFS